MPWVEGVISVGERDGGGPLSFPVADDGVGEEPASLGQRGRVAVFQMMARTVAIRLMALVGTAILARLLLPDDFGTFAVVSLLVNFLAPFVDFGLAPALIQQRHPPTKTEQATAFTLQFVVASLLCAALWLVAPVARAIAPSLPPDIDWMIRVAALVLPITALRALPVAMMSRVLRFGPLATIEVIQVAIYLGTSVVLAVAGAGAWSFIIALLAHSIASSVLPNMVWGWRLRFGFDRGVARRMLGFGVPFQATGILMAGREALVPAFGGLAGGLAAIGYLNFGMRLGRLAGSVDEIVARVAFPAFSRIQDASERLNRALVWGVGLTSLLLVVLLAWPVAVAPTLVPLVFSDQWQAAVPVFQLVAVGTMALAPANFVRGLAFAAGRGRETLIWSAVITVLAVVLFPVLLIAFGVAGGGLAFLTYSIAQLIANVHATRSVASFPWLGMLRIYFLGALAAAAASATNAWLGGVAGLLISGVIFGVVLTALLLAFERDQVRRAWDMIRGRTEGQAVYP